MEISDTNTMFKIVQKLCDEEVLSTIASRARMHMRYVRNARSRCLIFRRYEIRAPLKIARSCPHLSCSIYSCHQGSAILYHSVRILVHFTPEGRQW